MNSVTLQISLIFSIFVAGIILCFTINIAAGIGFIILANIALPFAIKLFPFSVFETSKS